MTELFKTKNDIICGRACELKVMSTALCAKCKCRYKLKASHSKNCWLEDCRWVALPGKPLEQFLTTFQVLLQDDQGRVPLNVLNR